MSRYSLFTFLFFFLLTGPNSYAQNDQGQIKLPENFMSKALPDSLKQAMLKFMADNPFSAMPRNEVKSFLLNNTEGKPLGRLFRRDPRSLDVVTDVVRDKKALPALFNIINRPKQMKNFSIVALVFFILSLVLNFMNTKGNLLKRILVKVLLMVFFFSANLANFYFFFRHELDPTIKIFMQHY